MKPIMQSAAATSRAFSCRYLTLLEIPFAYFQRQCIRHSSTGQHEKACWTIAVHPTALHVAEMALQQHPRQLWLCAGRFIDAVVSAEPCLGKAACQNHARIVCAFSLTGNLLKIRWGSSELI